MQYTLIHINTYTPCTIKGKWLPIIFWGKAHHFMRRVARCTNCAIANYKGIRYIRSCKRVQVLIKKVYLFIYKHTTRFSFIYWVRIKFKFFTSLLSADYIYYYNTYTLMRTQLCVKECNVWKIYSKMHFRILHIKYQAAAIVNISVKVTC